MTLFAERADGACPGLRAGAEPGRLSNGALLVLPAETPGACRIHAWREAVRDAEMLARADGQLLSDPAASAHEVPSIGADPARGSRVAYRRLKRRRAAIIGASIQLFDRLGALPWPTTHTDRTKAGRSNRPS